MNLKYKASYIGFVIITILLALIAIFCIPEVSGNITSNQSGEEIMDLKKETMFK